MPIYEYHCNKCGDFETMQRISDPPLTHCPTCRRKVTKLISSTSFHLKGSGWYVTDYARKADAKPPADKKGADSKADGKGGAAETAGASATSDAGSSASKDDGGSDSDGVKKSAAKAAAA